jgi:O-glycosyl hydrolase
MVAAVRRLREAGFTPEVIAPSTASARAAVDYIDKMLAVPGVAGVISTFAYHRYDGAAANMALRRILERAERIRVGTAMLEHLTGDVAELHDDLTKANVSAWQQYGIAYTSSPERERAGGYHYLVDLSTRERPTVRMAPRTRALAQYFRFVRAGAVRIGATSNNADKRAVAFTNANGAHVVVVYANRIGGTMSVVGLPPGSYGIRYTTGDETG